MGLDKKGQVASAELIFITLIVLIIMGGILTLIGGELNQVQTADMAKARTVGEKFAGAINAVYVAGSGYSANFTIPAGVTDPASTFNVNSTTPAVDVIYKGNKVSIKVIPKNINSFSITSAATDRIITIKNQNGTIQFT